MLKTEHRRGRAVVKVTSAVTDELAVELVSCIRRLRDECFHDRVELEIASNGGSVAALGYFLDALDGFRAGGMEFVTRALTSAASAAAVLVALGDRREASGGALLRFHAVRTSGVDEVTAQTAGALQGMLETADDRLMRRLVERGLRAGGAAPPPVAEAAAAMHDADWRVAAVLAGAAVTPRLGPEEVLARLRRRVGRCLRDSEGGELRRLYDGLFAFDAPISAALARELRLLDAVVNPGAPEVRAERPAAAVCRIPEWRAAFAPDGGVDRRLLCRHVLILGETGSGKTASGVLPAAAALLDPDNPVGCALVVDPKREIGPELRRLAASGGASVRTFEPRAGAGGPALDMMRGRDWSVAADLDAGRCLSAAHRILLRAGSLSPDNPANTLAGRTDGLREPYWPIEGARMAKTAVALALTALRRRAQLFAGLRTPEPPPDAAKAALRTLRRLGVKAGVLAPEPAGLRGVVERTLAAADEVWEMHGRLSSSRARGDGDDEWEDEWEDEEDGAEAAVVQAVAKAAAALRRDAGRLFPGAGGKGVRADLKRIADAAAESGSESGLRRAAEALPLAATRCLDDAELRPAPNVLALASDLLMTAFRSAPAAGGSLGASHLAKALLPLAESAEELEMLDQVEHWDALADDAASGHYAGLQSHAQNCLWEFADAAPAWTLYFGAEPQLGCGGPAAPALLDFDAAVDDERGRRLFLVQPALGGANDALVAKALKARFFEAVLGSRRRLRDGGRMPLVGYVADECHRFVTSDPAHGEQSFLDACRSFGAFCVLACQSVSSLKHALAAAGGGAAMNAAAVSVLLNNAGAKLFFRTTDPETHGLIAGLCPEPTEGPKVVDLRPPSTLLPGECYAALADGRFERRRLEAFDAARAKRRTGPESRPAPTPRFEGSGGPPRAEQ